MSGEVSAVITGDRMHALNQRFEQINDGLLHGFVGIAFNFRQARQLRASLDPRNDGLLMILADDGVGLPIAEPGLIGDHRRALIDAFAVRQLAATVIFTIALAALLLAAQMLIEVAALLLVSIDVL